MSEFDFCPICDLDLRPPWEREDWADFENDVGKPADALTLEHFDTVRWHAAHSSHAHLMDTPFAMEERGKFFATFKPLREKLG